MAISAALGERGTVEVPAGVLEYRERGSGPPVVFVHGAAVRTVVLLTPEEVDAAAKRSVDYRRPGA